MYRENVHKWLISDDCFTEPSREIKSSYVSGASSERLGTKSIQYITNKIKIIQNRWNRKINLFISNTSIDDNDHIGDYMQYILALSVLVRGGNMIVRSYHINLPFKIWILSTITRYFEDLWIVKPVSSPKYTADVFIVGHNFTGASKNDLDKLYYILSIFRKSYVDRILTKVSIDTVQSLYRFILYKTEEEISTKNKLINLYKEYNSDQQFYHTIEKRAQINADAYILAFDIKE